MAQFKTKARAVELLGKGQIADLPTAISELWKNGYDAYAKNLGCNLYLPGFEDISLPVFTLYDDGFGMTKTDLLDKWIVLGTDSKARGMKFYTDEERFGIVPRTAMGEKGIGRLSVSYLGSPMLMITRKMGNPLELLYFDWNVLENYNMFIDDIDIPIESVTCMDELIPTFMGMVKEFMIHVEKTVQAGQWDDQQLLLKTIRKENVISAIPRAILNSDQVQNIFQKGGHGTIFIVFNPDEQLKDLGNVPFGNDDNSTIEFKRSLCGIYNLFKREPDFSTEFYINNASGHYNIINEFFTNQDYSKGDWHIHGNFDNNGLFSGDVRVFKEIFPYTFRPNRIPGNTPYGPLELDLAGIEGSTKSSMLELDEYNLLSERTNHFGGLYVHRDNFRVLPYGRVDYDFLHFEERRSKKAGKYYFSHRNMFGYIGITRQGNSRLVDKAGREGFIENKAYKEFRRDLISFFEAVADKFFRSVDIGESNARSEQIKVIEKKNAKLLILENKKSAVTRKRFNDDIKNFTPRLYHLEDEIKELSRQIIQKGKEISVDFNEYNNLCEGLERKKSELLKLKLFKPTRAKLSSIQEKRFQNYSHCYDEITNFIKDCDKHISDVRQKFNAIDLKRDYEAMSNRVITDIINLVNSFRKRFRKSVETINNQFEKQKEYYINKLIKSLSDNTFALVTKEDYKEAINNQISISDQIKSEISDQMEPFIKHIEGLNFDIDEDYLISWYKNQDEKLSEQLEQTNALAQLGISAEIIDHELNHLYSQMKSSMEELSKYVKEHSEIQNLFQQMDHAFVQIENNYKMLQPFYHTRRRLNVKFDGKQLVMGLKSFFASKLKLGNISLDGSIAFNKFMFDAPEAVIYTTFINIVDNAIHWLIPVTNRKIFIDYSDDKIFIMNNGTKIDDGELDKIFVLFYTRKVNGRGIGLYLARKSMRGIGYDIYASNDKKDNRLGGACFIIKKYEK